MLAAFYKLHTKPGAKAKLIEFLKWDGEVARDTEPGTLRFDFFEDPEDEGAIYLYEAYRDEAALEAHKVNPPFQQYFSTVREECVDSVKFYLRLVPAIWSPED